MTAGESPCAAPDALPADGAALGLAALAFAAFGFEFLAMLAEEVDMERPIVCRKQKKPRFVRGAYAEPLNGPSSQPRVRNPAATSPML